MIKCNLWFILVILLTKSFVFVTHDRHVPCFQILSTKSPSGTSGSFWWTQRVKWSASGRRTSPWRAFGRKWPRWCEKSSSKNGWSYDGGWWWLTGHVLPVAMGDQTEPPQRSSIPPWKPEARGHACSFLRGCVYGWRWQPWWTFRMTTAAAQEGSF